LENCLCRLQNYKHTAQNGTLTVELDQWLMHVVAVLKSILGDLQHPYHIHGTQSTLSRSEWMCFDSLASLSDVCCIEVGGLHAGITGGTLAGLIISDQILGRSNPYTDVSHSP